MKFLATCFVLFHFMITIWGSDCPKRFIDIPTQQFFDEKQFEGKWYHQLHTTYVRANNEWISGVESIQLSDVGIYNLTYTAYSKQDKQCNVKTAPRLIMVRKGGSYHYNRGFVQMHILVISTDYENALVAFCFGELQDGMCPKYQSKYSIWSRSMEFPSRRVVDKMKHLVETQLCLDFTDFIEIEQGLCDFGAQNNYGQIETRCPTRPGHVQTEVGVTSANVTWTPPNDGSNVVVRGYRLGIGTDFDSVQSNDVENNYDSQHLANLVPDTEYVIKVTAYNNAGEGMATYQRIQTLKEPCAFDDISVQNNFDLNKFLGTWYVTSETTYVWGQSSWTSAVVRLQNDHHGHLVFLYSAMKEQHCMHAQEYHVAQTGEGILSFTEKEAATYKIVFTDYQHALVTVCFSSNSPCDQSRRQVEVWTRAGDYQIPDYVRQHMNDIVTNKLCIPLDDFVDSRPGICHLDDTHDEDCDHEHIVSHAHTDLHQLVGTWHTRYQTHLLWGNSTWSSKTRVVTVVNGTLILDHYGNSDGDCGLRFERKMVSQSTNNKGLLRSGSVPFSVVYMDDKFVILYTCAQENVSHHCDISKTHYEVMSRGTDKITPDEEHKLFQLICIPPEHLVEEQSPGSCYKKAQGPCVFDDISVQNNFDLNKFLGTWYVTSETTYVWGPNTWASSVVHLQYDHHGHLVLLYSAMKNQHCIHAQEYHVAQTGEGVLSHTEKEAATYKIVFTDYQHALVTVCFSSNSPCDQSRRQVEVWTRAGDFLIPDYVQRHMNDIITNRLCIPLGDFVDSIPGRCHLDDTHDEDCDHEHIVSHAHTDLHQLVGTWHTRYQTHTLWGNSTWSSKTRVFTFANNLLILDHYGNSDGDCGLRLGNEVVSQSANNGGELRSGSMSFSIVYMDDKFAILYKCAQENVSHHCDLSQTHYEVLSRGTDKITPDEEHKLFELICIPPENLVEEQSSGSCYYKAQAQQCKINTTLVQENFDPKKFAGTWHTREISNYLWGTNEIPQNLNRNFSFDENGTLHMTFNARFKQICFSGSGLTGFQIQKGHYHFQKDNLGYNTYLRIYMTDYRYAIVEFCLKGESDTECKNSSVEVMSRDLEPISYKHRQVLDQKLNEGFCTHMNGLQEVSIVNCFTRDEPYFGVSNRTITGKGCQRWKSESPHSHSYGDRLLPLDSYCRSYDWSVPWCYTLDPDTRWENCSVPVCVDDCVPASMAGKEKIAVEPMKSTSKEGGSIWNLSKLLKKLF